MGGPEGTAHLVFKNLQLIVSQKMFQIREGEIFFDGDVQVVR